MKRLPPLATGLALCFFQVASPLHPPAARAQAIQGIFSTRAQGLNAQPQKIHLWPGYDTSISFLETGEIIRHIQLSNLTRTVIYTDGTFQFNPSGSTSGEARVIYLRAIEQLPTEGSFTGLLTAPTASLFVIAERPDGRQQQYVFEVMHESGRPRYSALRVFPDSRGIAFIELGGLQRASIEQLERGLRLSREQTPEAADIHARVSEWIALVRNGALFPQASSQAGVGMGVIQDLARQGLIDEQAQGQLTLLQSN